MINRCNQIFSFVCCSVLIVLLLRTVFVSLSQLFKLLSIPGISILAFASFQFLASSKSSLMSQKHRTTHTNPNPHQHLSDKEHYPSEKTQKNQLQTNHVNKTFHRGRKKDTVRCLWRFTQTLDPNSVGRSRSQRSNGKWQRGSFHR